MLGAMMGGCGGGWGGAGYGPDGAFAAPGAAAKPAGGFKVKICTFWEQGKCTRGADCTFAHGSEDLGASGGASASADNWGAPDPSWGCAGGAGYGDAWGKGKGG